MSSTLIFTNIQHGFRKKNGLSCNEYIILDMVYHLHTNPTSQIKDWCYMSRDTMAKELGISKRGLINIISKLCDDGFLLKNEVTKHLQTTKKWNNVYFTNGAESSPMVQKVHVPSAKSALGSGEESALDGGEESAPNNNIIYNNIKDNNTYNINKGDDYFLSDVVEILEETETLTQIETSLKKEKNSAKKEKKNELEKSFEEIYQKFYKKIMGGDGEAVFGKWEMVALREIIEKCKKLTPQGQSEIDAWRVMANYDSWQTMGKFWQDKFGIKQINNNFDSIFYQMKNYRQSNRTPNKYIDGLIEANKINQQKIKDGTFNDDPFKDILQYKS